MDGGNSPNRFDEEDVRDAVSVLSELRQGRLDGEFDASETGVDNLQREATGEEKASIYADFRSGELGETVARIILGNALETIEQDRVAVHEILGEDNSDLIQ